MHIARRTVLAGIAGAAGCAAFTAAALAKSRQAPGQASSLGQHGITWAFSGTHRVGRYAQGDWWVVGPVEIVGIDPASRSGDRVMNGAMINPKGAGKQGYDSAPHGPQGGNRYDPALNVALDVSPEKPLRVEPGSSLISTISIPEIEERQQLRTAAILTVVDAPPREGAFRPPYCGTDKTHRWSAADLQRGRLLRLRSAGGRPALSELERNLERPWIDHGKSWFSGMWKPAENMPYYGREISLITCDAALVLNTDLPVDKKEKLLRRYVQLGIDLLGVAENGGGWPADGGHASGRKLPILFAGRLLDEPRFYACGGPDVPFGEDRQTFYVEETAPGEINHGDGGYGPEDVGLPEWGIRHDTSPKSDSKSWEARYRTCCTANVWTAAVLTAHAMGLREIWNHQALFDYQDRYMAHDQAEPWLRSMSPWAGDMWDMHRASYPPVWTAGSARPAPRNHSDT